MRIPTPRQAEPLSRQYTGEEERQAKEITGELQECEVWQAVHVVFISQSIPPCQACQGGRRRCPWQSRCTLRAYRFLLGVSSDMRSKLQSWQTVLGLRCRCC